MSKALTVAIVGAGRIAGGYDRDRLDDSPGIFTHAGAYTRDGRFTLKTVIDTDEQKARCFAEEWKVSYIGTKIADLCKDYHDIISVCTPDHTHAAVISELISGQAAKTIFAEKPLALTNREMRDIQRLSEENQVHVFVNFQRRFDPAHRQLRDIIAAGQVKILAVNTFYIKGLDHIGTTLIDTLCFFCGDPNSVLAYNRIFNVDIQDYTYEFILYFDTFNATAKTIDIESADYLYHIFEIDILMNDKRVVINDNSRRVETRLVCDYAYSGIRCIDDRHPVAEETGYAFSMLNSVQYLYEITNGSRPHNDNTPKSSIRNKCIIEAVKRSYDQKKRIEVGENHE
jgi:predicted dehydrogenase